ncbi:type II toxin-antitoxin system RelE/ParE family toxin [Sphingosinicella sp.]|uniref:type II toxin-antitoxin system RelE/ParE family toxin n=1 Tax=Sphingosinicella sp. TaxID=1917971 RepID=UPI004037DBA1
MRVYLTKVFARDARKADVADEALFEAIDRAERGLIDADLGGGLIKQRVARPGKGRSGGYRTIVAYREAERAIFMLMFAKSAQANIAAAELEEIREIAKPLMRLDDKRLNELAAAREWREIEKNDGQKTLP